MKIIILSKLKMQYFHLVEKTLMKNKTKAKPRNKSFYVLSSLIVSKNMKYYFQIFICVW